MKVKRNEKSYAKINIHLHVGSKRKDGYHPLSSLFHLVDLYDIITLNLEESSRTQLSITGMDTVPLAQNLMYRAVTLFLTTIGAKAKVHIDIIKNIPMQGGLGGGSSNAATILLQLQNIYNYPLSNEHLYELGLSLGSDVPFFLHQHPAAFVQGRGEYITPIKARGDLSLLLTFPHNIGVSTKQAFDDLDKTRGDGWVEPASMNVDEVCHMYNNPVEHWKFYNDFKIITFLYKELHDILEALEGEGSNMYTSISGSGSTLFTITDKDEELSTLPFLREKYRTQVINNLTTCLYLL